MKLTEYPATLPCHIPAGCFNLARLARKRANGYVEVNLPGMFDNTLRIGADRWTCWNRKLGEKLLTWEGFRNAERTGLLEPVECSLTVHHSYSRTIIWHVYDSLATALQKELDNIGPAPTTTATVFDWPLSDKEKPLQPALN